MIGKIKLQEMVYETSLNLIPLLVRDLCQKGYTFIYVEVAIWQTGIGHATLNIGTVLTLYNASCYLKEQNKQYFTISQ